MAYIDKPGSFYLGKIIDPDKKRETKEDILQFDAKYLTTHAVCVGMTGSGKTGLCIDILEEAAINKIPAIIIDPKGDLGNLLLTFPHLSPDEFLPWIDMSEAARKGMEPADYSKIVSKTWTDGLSKWGQGLERIETLKNNVEMVIYTPASNSGVPISILSSFAAPSRELMLDKELIRDRIMSVTSSLLGLLGINADPVKSREHILISTLIALAWEKGVDLDIAALIQQVQKPPFNKIGALDIDTFYPSKERIALSISINNLLASPGFQGWMDGEPLDIQKLYYTKEGKPKLSIFSIGHLSDPERMFFVTILLNELLTWMRRQPGSSSLKALLYMDEIFGYFPPTAMPPSKLPMLMLLKQARAFGLGVVLTTQNPVDLDYKGLSNCGTWFIGKLQTERDKARVLEGLQVASNGEIDAKTLDKMIAMTGTRIFIMRSIYEKAPILFETRWTMSYLRGPLTLPQISQLTVKQELPLQEYDKVDINIQNSSQGFTKPIIPSNIPEYFWNKSPAAESPSYRPLIMGSAKLHFIDSKNKIDTWESLSLLAPVDETGSNVRWDEGKIYKDFLSFLEKEPTIGKTFEELPPGLMKEKNYEMFQKSFLAYIYETQSMAIFHHPELKLTSTPWQTETEFRATIALAVQERIEEAVIKTQTTYQEKIAQISDKLQRAQKKMADKQQKAIWQKIDTGVSFFTSILDAVLGRGVTKGTISKAGTSIRRAGKMSQESQAVLSAEDECKNYQQQLMNLQTQLSDELERIRSSFDSTSVPLESIIIRPRKSDISVNSIALVWSPI